MGKQTLKDGMKVRMPRGAKCDYFTPGKEYTVSEVTRSVQFGFKFRITTDSLGDDLDDNLQTICLLKKCEHLKGKNWIIVK